MKRVADFSAVQNCHKKNILTLFSVLKKGYHLLLIIANVGTLSMVLQCAIHRPRSCIKCLKEFVVSDMGAERGGENQEGPPP
jgi:hypothetical protein